MASGKAAQPVYKLWDDLGGEDSLTATHTLCEFLIRWLDVTDLENFVEQARRVLELPEKEETDSEEEDEEQWESEEESEEESG